MTALKTGLQTQEDRDFTAVLEQPFSKYSESWNILILVAMSKSCCCCTYVNMKSTFLRHALSWANEHTVAQSFLCSALTFSDTSTPGETSCEHRKDCQNAK